MIFLKKGIIFLFAFTSFTFVVEASSSVVPWKGYDIHSNNLNCTNENESGADCTLETSYNPARGFQQKNMSPEISKNYCLEFITKKLKNYHKNKIEDALIAAFRRENSDEEFDILEESSFTSPLRALQRGSEVRQVNSTHYLVLALEPKPFVTNEQPDESVYYIQIKDTLKATMTLKSLSTSRRHSDSSAGVTINLTNSDNYRLQLILDDDKISDETSYDNLGNPEDNFKMKCDFRINYQEFNPSGNWVNNETEITSEF